MSISETFLLRIARRFLQPRLSYSRSFRHQRQLTTLIQWYVYFHKDYNIYGGEQRYTIIACGREKRCWVGEIKITIYSDTFLSWGWIRASSHKVLPEHAHTFFMFSKAPALRAMIPHKIPGPLFPSHLLSLVLPLPKSS